MLRTHRLSVIIPPYTDSSFLSHISSISNMSQSSSSSSILSLFDVALQGLRKSDRGHAGWHAAGTLCIWLWTAESLAAHQRARCGYFPGASAGTCSERCCVESGRRCGRSGPDRRGWDRHGQRRHRRRRRHGRRRRRCTCEAREDRI